MKTENESIAIIHECAALRGKGLFDLAIATITKHMNEIHADTRVNALLEAFYAAKEKGDVAETKKYARMVAIEDARVPSIQEYLN